MIHSARPTVSLIAYIVFTWNLFCFEKWGRTDGRTTCAKMMITTDRDSGSASWIKKLKGTPLATLVTRLIQSSIQPDPNLRSCFDLARISLPSWRVLLLCKTGKAAWEIIKGGILSLFDPRGRPTVHRSDHYFQTWCLYVRTYVCASVRPSPMFKISQNKTNVKRIGIATGETMVWPSGSLMTHISFLLFPSLKLHSDHLPRFLVCLSADRFLLLPCLYLWISPLYFFFFSRCAID